MIIKKNYNNNNNKNRRGIHKNHAAIAFMATSNVQFCLTECVFFNQFQNCHYHFYIEIDIIIDRAYDKVGGRGRYWEQIEDRGKNAQSNMGYNIFILSTFLYL